jgi:hypothetical protein
METIAIFISFFISVCSAVLLPFFFIGKRYRVAQEKAHTRRLAEARMNARLLRFNL